MADDITVFIAGEHRLEQPLVFGPEDSGSNGYSIVYTAAPGEHPILSGGTHLTGWKLADKARNLWTAPVPASLTSSYDLFVNGTPANRTRGRLLRVFVKGPADGTPSSPDSTALWKNPADVLFERPGPGAIWSEASVNAPPFVANAFELLGMPGEWYFDRPAHQIYYTPRVGEDMGVADVVVAQAAALVRAHGTGERPVTGLIFKGIRFEYATASDPSDASPESPSGAQGPPAAIVCTFCSGIQFLEDEFLHMGIPALGLGPSVDGATVDGCLFGQIAWSGLRVSGSSRVRIAESRFSYVATRHNRSGALELDHSDEVSIENCQIDHYPSLAVAATFENPGAIRETANRVTRPMAGYHGKPVAGTAAPSADAGLPSAYRSLADERFSALTTPRPPIHVSAEAEDRFAYVTWEPSCQDGGAPVLYYTVASSSGSTTSVSAEDFEAKGYVNFTGLENGHSVTFVVSCANRIGSSPPSPPTASVTPSRKRRQKAPSAPASVSIISGTPTATLVIAPPSSDGGSPIVAYAVRSSSGSWERVLEGLDVIRSGPSNPLARALPDLPSDPAQAVVVTAVNAEGEGEPTPARRSR